MAKFKKGDKVVCRDLKGFDQLASLPIINHPYIIDCTVDYNWSDAKFGTDSIRTEEGYGGYWPSDLFELYEEPKLSIATLDDNTYYYVDNGGGYSWITKGNKHACFYDDKKKLSKFIPNWEPNLSAIWNNLREATPEEIERYKKDSGEKDEKKLEYKDIENGEVFYMDGGEAYKYIMKKGERGFIHISEKQWHNIDTYHFSWEVYNYRKATTEEIYQYNACKAANKFVPWEEANRLKCPPVLEVFAKEEHSEQKDRIEVFPGIYIGDIVVSLENLLGCRDVGEMMEVSGEKENMSKKGNLSYRSSKYGVSTSTKPTTWRLATLEEKEAYKQGIRNIKDIPKASNHEDVYKAKYVKCISLVENKVMGWASSFKIGRIYESKGKSNTQNLIVNCGEGYSNFFCDVECFTPATEEEWKKQKEEITISGGENPIIKAEEKWAIGGYVRITQNGFYRNSYNAGEIWRITEENNNFFSGDTINVERNGKTARVFCNNKQGLAECEWIGMEKPLDKEVKETMKYFGHNLITEKEIDDYGVYIAGVDPYKGASGNTICVGGIDYYKFESEEYSPMDKYEQKPIILPKRNTKRKLVII